ncbi:MAG: ATPase, T2SS/T4P/T4SS family [Candidatus Diapherotrites archaeon]
MHEFREQKGEKIDSYDVVDIYEGFPYFFYDVMDAELTEKERVFVKILEKIIHGRGSLEEIKTQFPKISKQFIEEFSDKIASPIGPSDITVKIPEMEIFNALKINLIALFKEFVPFVENHAGLANAVLDKSVGLGILAPLIRDHELEEIMVNGCKRPIFVFHKRYGMCKTNLFFDEAKDMDYLITKIANTVGKQFSTEYPLLDARVSGGNRANATHNLVTPYGSTLTIRKFTKVPLSIVNLVENNTISSEVAAFLWVMVEGMNIEPMNLIITGGAGSGKTTTLNVLSTFIPYQERVITLEDTLELDLGSRQNWIQMESKPETMGSKGVSMDSLLKNALRMRPNRLIVGEVRGPEAQTLFVAMDIGHRGCLGTLHSNTAREMLLRLKAEPMGVPDAMIPLLDLIVVQYKMYVRGKGVMRRIAHISEISSMQKTALLANVYEWKRDKDELVRTDVPSHIIEILAEKTMRSKNEVRKEMGIRQNIIEWMLKNNIRANPDVETIIQRYYYDPETVLKEVMKDLGKDLD